MEGIENTHICLNAFQTGLTCILSWFHFKATLQCYGLSFTGIMLCMRPANEGRRHNVTLSLIDWTHAQNDPGCIYHITVVLDREVENGNTHEMQKSKLNLKTNTTSLACFGRVHRGWEWAPQYLSDSKYMGMCIFPSRDWCQINGYTCNVLMSIRFQLALNCLVAINLRSAGGIVTEITSLLVTSNKTCHCVFPSIFVGVLTLL